MLYAVQTVEGVAAGAMDFTQLTGAPGFSTKCGVSLKESGVHQVWEDYVSENSQLGQKPAISGLS